MIQMKVFKCKSIILTGVSSGTDGSDVSIRERVKTLL